jgi:hypothetical protein
MLLQTFVRRRITPERITGVLVGESDELLLVHEVYDFEFYGYTVIRRRDMKALPPNDNNVYYESLMRKEKLWRNPKRAIQRLPIENWQSLLTAIQGQYAIIENERTGDFLIGPILKCTSSSVTMHYFSPRGEWGKIERFPLRLITKVQLENRYINIHARHLPPRTE